MDTKSLMCISEGGRHWKDFNRFPLKNAMRITSLGCNAGSKFRRNTTVGLHLNTVDVYSRDEQSVAFGLI